MYCNHTKKKKSGSQLYYLKLFILLLCEISHTWSENLASLNLTDMMSIDIQRHKILFIVISKDVNIY